MPTGYTAALTKRNYNLKQWLLNDVIRAIGVCVMLRDESSDLNCNQIRAKLVEHVEYAEKQKAKLTEVVERHKQYLNMSATAWLTSFTAESSRVREENEKRKQEHVDGHRAHEKALSKLRLLLAKAEGEVTVGVLKFAADQVNSAIGFDFNSCYQEKEYSDVTAYRAAKIQEAEREIKYTQENVNECLKRAQERLKAFDAYVAEIDKLIPGEVEKSMALPIKKASKAKKGRK